MPRTQIYFSRLIVGNKETVQKETELKSVVCKMKGASACIDFCTQILNHKNTWALGRNSRILGITCDQTQF